MPRTIERSFAFTPRAFEEKALMKCLTLFTWIVAGTMVAAPAVAQVTPPAPPRPETAPTARPMRAPRANEWPNELPLRLELEQQELEQRRQERKFDLDLPTPRARPFDLELPVPATPAVAPLPPLPPVPAASSYVETNETRVPEALDGAFLNRRPPAPWAAHDPADSLYRVAREALNRGDYRRAAQLFNDLTQRFPNSSYAYVSAYYEAFSRYRIGTTEELLAADHALRGIAERSAQTSNGWRGDNTDVEGLRTRIRGALAVRGDSDAEITVKETAR